MWVSDRWWPQSCSVFSQTGWNHGPSTPPRAEEEETHGDAQCRSRQGHGAAPRRCSVYDAAQPPGEHLGKSIEDALVSNPAAQLQGLLIAFCSNISYWSIAALQCCRCFCCTNKWFHYIYIYLPAMQETQVRSLGWEDLLEKGRTTHSIILAWRIPRTEECSRLQSMGLQRVVHEWVLTLPLSSPHMYIYAIFKNILFHYGLSSLNRILNVVLSATQSLVVYPAHI